MLENAESNNLEKAYNLPLASHLNLFDRNFDHIVVNPSQAHLHLCHTDHVAGGEDDGDDGDKPLIKQTIIFLLLLLLLLLLTIITSKTMVWARRLLIQLC